jgi:tetratricopeptide (TPR) repeat protein
VFLMPLLKRAKDSKYRDAAKLLANGNAKEAITKLRSIISEKPDNVNARVCLAVALIQSQEKPDINSPLTKEAMEQLDLAAEKAPKDPVPYFNKGVLLRNLGLKEEALSAFEKALEIEERLPLAVLHMAEINYELENWDKAVELARLALVRDPGLEPNMGWVRVAMRKAGMLDDDGNVISKAENEDAWPMRKP